MKTLLIFFLFLVLFLKESFQKPKENQADKDFKKISGSCERNNCSHIPQYFNENCINNCVSSDCYNEVFGDDPLEPGELNVKKNRVFRECIERNNKRMEYSKKIKN